MPIYRLDKAVIAFPPPHHADSSGLLAVGGDFRPERMLLAYASGIFPWSEYGGQPLWYSPDPRMILTPETLHIRRSLAKIMRRGDYEVKLDSAFEAVIAACAGAPRPGQDGTWITRRYREAMSALHNAGWAHSAEAWQDGRLVGGLYGLSIGRAFFGESMFAAAPNASKVAFVTLVQQLGEWGIDLVDCQVETPHLRSFGAEEWPRARFLHALGERVAGPTRLGPWTLTVANGPG